MERADRNALGLAVFGHVALFTLLSLVLLQPKLPPIPKAQPLDVSLVPDVALEAQAPQTVTPPAKAQAPDTGAPEGAAPPPAAPAPPKPAPPKPAPVAQPRPAPAPKVADAVPPKPRQAAATKPAPARPISSHAAISSKPDTSESNATARPRSSRLGADFLKGLSSEDSKSTAQVAQAARVDPAALASIISAIARQIQPCADRQVNPGPGANEIAIKLNLRLARDGTLAGTPTMVGIPTGVSDENERYVQRVRDLGIAAFRGCSPLKLPAEYYQTANGGWSNINYTWKLR